MADKQRGDDAQDQSPKPGKPAGAESAPPSREQDAANYATRTDGGKAIKVEDLSSANDEGAP